MVHKGVQYGRLKPDFPHTLSLCRDKPYIHVLNRYSCVRNGLRAQNMNATLELGGQ